jgi:hypothetical protein
LHRECTWAIDGNFALFEVVKVLIDLLNVCERSSTVFLVKNCMSSRLGTELPSCSSPGTRMGSYGLGLSAGLLLL